VVRPVTNLHDYLDIVPVCLSSSYRKCEGNPGTYGLSMRRSQQQWLRGPTARDQYGDGNECEARSREHSSGY
jgi:hypothetical protein